MKPAWLNYTNYILTVRDEYNSYNIGNINILSYLTIPNITVFKFRNDGA